MRIGDADRGDNRRDLGIVQGVENHRDEMAEALPRRGVVRADVRPPFDGVQLRHQVVCR